MYCSRKIRDRLIATSNFIYQMSDNIEKKDYASGSSLTSSTSTTSYWVEQVFREETEEFLEMEETSLELCSRNKASASWEEKRLPRSEEMKRRRRTPSDWSTAEKNLDTSFES